jgi:hypothetical protein
MWMRAKRVWLLVPLPLLPAVLWVRFQQHEPAANGHSLSYLVLACFPDPPAPTNSPPGISIIFGNGPSILSRGGADYLAFPNVNATNYQAIRQIWTNALPFLRNWSQYQAPTWRSWLARRSHTYPCPWILRWLSRVDERPVNLAERSRWLLLAQKDPPTLAAFTNYYIITPGRPLIILDIHMNSP